MASVYCIVCLQAKVWSPSPPVYLTPCTLVVLPYASSPLVTPFSCLYRWVWFLFVCMFVLFVHLLLFVFFCFIKFIGVTSVKKLYRFQLYIYIINHLYTVLCICQPKSSLLPSPFIYPIFPLVITTCFLCLWEVFFLLNSSAYIQHEWNHTVVVFLSDITFNIILSWFM